MVVKAISSWAKLRINKYWYSESSLVDDMQYELEESDVCSMDVLSMPLNEEYLLELCPLGERSTICNVITVFYWWYWDWYFCFFLFSFNRMELVECCIVLMSIEEGVGVLVRVGWGDEYDGRGGELLLFNLCMLVFVFFRRLLRLDFIISQ